MVSNNICGGRALRIAVGIATLVLLLAGGAGATKVINDNATGGDCTSIGTWNVGSKNCTLTTDLAVTIEIDSDAITLNGNGHTITGSNTTWNGISLSGRNGVTIKNTNVRNFDYGIYLYSSSNNTLSGNNASNNNYGIYLYNSSNSTLSGNNANSNNNIGIYLSSFSNNTLSNNNASNNNIGIWLDGTNNNTVSGSNASNNNYGIFLDPSSKNNTLSGNTVNSNYNEGISLMSSGNMLSGNSESNNNYGIYLSSSSNNTLSGNTALNNSLGIYMSSSSDNTLDGNNVSNNYLVGIYLSSSSNNTLSGNNVSNNKRGGIYLSSSSNNTLSGNTASNNYDGIELQSSSNSTLINNTMNGNNINFGVDSYWDPTKPAPPIPPPFDCEDIRAFLVWRGTNSDFDNSIDISNTVDGKTVLYIKNGEDTIYDDSSNAGTIYCIWCNNVTFKNLTLTKNGYGVFFWGTNNSKLKSIDALNNIHGIELHSSNNNTLSGNNASNGGFGIYLFSSSNNMLSGNNASNDENGIWLDGSSNNTLVGNIANSNGNWYNVEAGICMFSSSNNMLSGNNASNNYYGIDLSGSSGNTIYDNLFKNNINNFKLDYSANRWNISKTLGTSIVGGPYIGGNFWEGFSQTCTDEDGDGICDSPYALDSNNTDYLPLAYKSISTPTANVSISGFSFQPQTINVTAGTTVTWTNLDSVTHTVTSDTGLFDSGPLSNGQTFSLTFNTAGSYDYHCSIHSFMTGSVIVSSPAVTPTIVGNIAYSNNGTGISGATVNLTNASGVIATTATNSSGGYNFTNVMPGSYNVTASKPRFFSNSTSGVVVTAGSTNTMNQILWMKGDLNNNGIPADAGDLVLMKRAAIGEIPADFRYDLNNNGVSADAGDLVLMKRAAIGEIILS